MRAQAAAAPATAEIDRLLGWFGSFVRWQALRPLAPFAPFASAAQHSTHASSGSSIYRRPDLERRAKQLTHFYNIQCFEQRSEERKRTESKLKHK